MTMPVSRPLAALFAALATLALAACSEPAPVTAKPAGKEREPLPPPLFAVVYRCADGTSFTTFPRGDSVQLDFANRTRTLMKVPAAAGTKFSDGETTVATEGNAATLAQADSSHEDCQGTEVHSVWEAAKLRGVALRAVGNEPGWLLELTPGGELVFAWDYGAQRTSAAAPIGTRDPARQTTTYVARTGKGELRVAITDGYCSDGMSAEKYAATATVTFKGKTWSGCAKTL